MSTQITPPNDTQPPNFDKVQEITVEYDEIKDIVTVDPPSIGKGATVLFKSTKGTRLRIEFLLPNGEETRSISDLETYVLSVGGTFHFKCFFTFPGAQKEFPKHGGIIDVVPQRP